MLRAEPTMSIQTVREMFSDKTTKHGNKTAEVTAGKMPTHPPGQNPEIFATNPLTEVAERNATTTFSRTVYLREEEVSHAPVGQAVADPCQVVGKIPCLDYANCLSNLHLTSKYILHYV